MSLSEIWLSPCDTASAATLSSMPSIADIVPHKGHGLRVCNVANNSLSSQVSALSRLYLKKMVILKYANILSGQNIAGLLSFTVKYTSLAVM